MKKVRGFGILVLALVLGIFGSSIEVKAESCTNSSAASLSANTITEDELARAVNNAKQALETVSAITTDEVANAKVYLEGLVAMGEERVVNFSQYQNENLCSLVAALDEGAAGVVLLSGINNKSVSTLSTDNTNVKKVAVADLKEEAVTPVQQTATVYRTTNTSSKSEVAETAGNVEVKVTVQPAEKIEEIENVNDTLSEEVELPSTGEETKVKHPAARLAVAGGTILVSLGMGALLIKKWNKDDKKY